jgi:uncharacterized protein (DUF927 family)
VPFCLKQNILLVQHFNIKHVNNIFLYGNAEFSADQNKDIFSVVHLVCLKNITKFG